MNGQRFYGKYQGEVVDNVDELLLYRLKVRVESIPATHAGVWARPCVPYVGKNVGFCSLPPKGARVWVEFEAGNPNLPIWVGGFWEETQFLLPQKTDLLRYPDVKAWKTRNCRLVLDDQDADGEVLLEIDDPAVEVPVTMKFYNQGVEIETGISKMTINPESGFVLSVGENTRLSLSPEGINMIAPKISVKAEGEINFDAGGVLNASAGEDASIKAVGALQEEAGGEVGIKAGGAVNVSGGADLKLGAKGAAQLTAIGDLSMDSASAVATIEVIDINGAVNINEAVNVDGAMNVNGTIFEDGEPVATIPV